MRRQSWLPCLAMTDPCLTSVALFDRHATHYAERYFDLDLYQPHLTRFAHADARRCLASLHAVLTDGAPLYLATITGATASAGWQKGSTGGAAWMVYRTMSQVLALLQEAGFAIVWHELMDSPPGAAPSRDLVLLARRHSAKQAA